MMAPIPRLGQLHVQRWYSQCHCRTFNNIYQPWTNGMSDLEPNVPAQTLTQTGAHTFVNASTFNQLESKYR